MFENQLKELFELTNTKNMNQLSKYFGFENNSTVSKWKKNGRIPEQYMLKAENEHLKSILNSNSYINQNTMQIRYFADVSASCGYGCENDVLEYKEFKIDKSVAKNILNLPTNHSTLDIIKVFGDSMEPFIYSGELAAVDIKKNTLDSIKNGDVVIINVDGELYCKKLVKDPFSRTLHLVSYNKEYPERALSYDEFNNVIIVGVVCQVLNIRTFENGIQKIL